MILKLVTLACAIYGGLALSMYLFQGRLMFAPNRVLTFTPADIGLDFEEVLIRPIDGPTLHAWYIAHPDALYTVLFCHGNAGNISHRLESLRLLNDLGLNVLIFDYAGFGKSQGKPSEHQTYEDVDAVWKYLTTERGVSPANILLFGRSLGGGVATWLATKEKPHGLILESTFTSVPELGQALYPWLPVKWLARIQYDNLTRIKTIHTPLLILHSREDELIAFAHAQALYEAANEPKTLGAFTGGHNDGFLTSGEHYRRSWETYLLTL